MVGVNAALLGRSRWPDAEPPPATAATEGNAAVVGVKEVLLAMSGGVDSSVAALLLLDAGYRVTGVTMKLWGGEGDKGCCSVADVDDARRVADHLGIEHHVFNFGDDFERHVVEPYVAAHQRGVTPNPCIECNRHLKFDKLLQRAGALGIDLVATGHHARVVTQADGVRRIARGADAAKDQSYVLSMLDQRALARLLLPVGELSDKAEVRRLAAAAGLRTADKPDSQDVCFITASAGRRAFLGQRIPLRTARLVDLEGQDQGTVDAVELVTVGQRRGLAVSGAPARRFVVDVDPAAGVVTMGSEADLLRRSERVSGLTWTSGPVDGDVLVQCSAHGVPQRAILRLDCPGGEIRWQEPQRRVSPGQSAVFYDLGDRHVLGGGVVIRGPEAMAG
jgi:tRNA-uridine 2-sulfurtransferase